MRQLRNLATLALALTLVAAACGGGADETPETIRLIAHDSFAEAVDESTFAAFTEDTGIEVEVIAADDAGSMVNQVILSKDNPLADVLFGVDDTFLSRAVDEGVFLPYESASLAAVTESLRPPTHAVTPIDYGDVCFNYDKAWFEDSQLALPDDLDEMLSDTYAHLVTVEHPATSSPGLAFMLATIGIYGEDGWLDWWAGMRDGGINVVSDWNTAYYGAFTRSGGDTPIVLSYASSPPVEVIFAEEPLDTAPTGVIEAGCYRQIEYAGILEGTPYPDAAGQLIDFMLSVEFQETIPETWFVFPANQDAALPETFVEHTAIPTDPIQFEYDYIDQNRETWIDQWVEVMGG